MFYLIVCMLTNLFAVLANPVPQGLNDVSFDTGPLPVGESLLAEETSPADQTPDTNSLVSSGDRQLAGCIQNTSTEKLYDNDKLADDDSGQSPGILRRGGQTLCPVERPDTILAPVPQTQQSETRPHESPTRNSQLCKDDPGYSILLSCQGPVVVDMHTVSPQWDVDVVINCVVGKFCFLPNSIKY